MSDLAALLADAWRIAFLTAAAPVIGSVLLLATARLTGARWPGVEGPARLAPLLIPGGAIVGIAHIGHPPPDHLSLWMAWWAVGVRAALAGMLLRYAAAGLQRRAGTTFAAVALAIYTVVVTPIASDWMLGQVPGHPVSAIGMMLTVEAIAGAAAWLLATGRGDAQTRSDMARLLVAAALGLGYLVFMDYLIVWFGNLPPRVGFYLDRGTPAMAALLWGALLAGVAAPIALLSLVEGERGRRWAGAAALAGMALFNAWWVAGGLAAMLLGLVLAAIAGALVRRKAAYG